MEKQTLTVEDYKRGYSVDAQSGAFRCLGCDRSFEPGEVYGMDGRFFEAARAVERHIADEHPGYLRELVHGDSKYNTLTANQRQLLELFAAGLTDKEIAARTGVTPSTVRRQKFMFRERAKQARLYLAIYESALEGGREGGQAVVDIHDNARMVDKRYVVTQEEREHILDTAFSSRDPLILKQLSPKEKKKIVILTEIAAQFQRGRRYTEQEVNAVLEAIYADFATIRRYLIEYGFMQREINGSAYWLA